MKELIGRDHGNAIPWADLMAQRAADTAGQVDGAGLVYAFKALTGQCADAVDGADAQAGFAAGTHVLIEQGQYFWEFLFCHDSQYSRFAL